MQHLTKLISTSSWEPFFTQLSDTTLHWFPSTFTGCSFSVSSFAGSTSSPHAHWAKSSDLLPFLFTFTVLMTLPSLMALNNICTWMTTKYVSLACPSPLHSKLQYPTSCLASLLGRPVHISNACHTKPSSWYVLPKSFLSLDFSVLGNGNSDLPVDLTKNLEVILDSSLLHLQELSISWLKYCSGVLAGILSSALFPFRQPSSQ